MAETSENRRLYIEVLQRMTPEQRLRKALELTQLVRELSRAGFRNRNPELNPAEIDRLVVENIIRCHSRTY
ncbi:MAG: hypothetical protein L0271_15325 [Gemmatimonadetes bacterium]|nr:hypothetical protein [Gemmatimonadota bacterium]